MKAIFFICLITFSLALRKTQYTALQQASFGSILAQVQAQIKAGGPLDNVFGLLDDLEEQINTEQREHQAMLDANDALCDEEQAFRLGEVQEGTKALKAAEKHHLTCSSSLESAQTDLATTRQNLADDKSALAQATQVRESEKETFARRAQDHVNAQRALDGALSILDELVAQDVTLIQFSQHSAVLLKTGVKIGLTSKYAPVVAMFAKMATSNINMFMEDASVGRIKTMLEQLKDNIAESARQYAEEETLRQEQFDILKQKLETSINTLEVNEQRLLDHIEEMEQCVLEESLVMSDAQQKITRNQNLLDTSVSMCDSFRAEFASATDARDEELELLDTVRTMVRRKLAGLGGTSVGARDDNFDQYEHNEFEEGEIWASAA